MGDPVKQIINGGYFNVLEPNIEDINLEVISHALSNICRYGGHTREFYSVAQHAILTSLLVPREHAMAALLHDSAEAYIGDVVTPLKALLDEYKRIEHNIEAAIFATFGIPFPMDPCVKRADLILLATERRDMVGKSKQPDKDDEAWACLRGISPMPTQLRALTPAEAKGAFLRRFDEIRATQEPFDGRQCPYCGGTILGDGYTTAQICEFVEDPPTDREPDAPILFCDSWIDIKYRADGSITTTDGEIDERVTQILASEYAGIKKEEAENRYAARDALADDLKDRLETFGLIV